MSTLNKHTTIILCLMLLAVMLYTLPFDLLNGILICTGWILIVENAHDCEIPFMDGVIRTEPYDPNFKSN